MDEISALELIFRSNLVRDGGRIVIRNQMAVYSVCPETMRIVGPSREYADVYDYVLKDSQCCATKAVVQVTGTYAAVPEAERITAEQFHCWQREQQSRAPRQDAGRPSGREAWRLGPRYAEDE